MGGISHSHLDFDETLNVQTRRSSAEAPGTPLPWSVISPLHLPTSGFQHKRASTGSNFLVGAINWQIVKILFNSNIFKSPLLLCFEAWGGKGAETLNSFYSAVSGREGQQSEALNCELEKNLLQSLENEELNRTL